jgi:RNA polymerase sigma factor (sigma-70 family)
MSSQHSITGLIGRLRGGEQAAAQRLWETYFDRLARVAPRRLPARRPAVADEEDLALSALRSACRGLRAGRYPQLTDRDDLWRLLVTIVHHKALHLVRDQGRQKRGGQAVPEGTLSQILGREPTPELAAEMAEEYQRLLDPLGDETLRRVAQWKMEGWTNEEIAARLDCTPRTVERKLRLIRRTWEGAGG